MQLKKHRGIIQMFTVVRILRGALLAYPVALEAQQQVSFPTPDSGIVYADLYGKGPRGVVLAHGGRFTKSSWEPQAKVLATLGFHVIAIDFRGRGRSHGGHAGDDGAYLDVLAAVRYLRDSGVKSVAVVGASFGGGAAAEASVASTSGEIDRLVLLAASVAQPERIRGRTLFITSRGDTNASGGQRLPQIRKQYKRAPEPKELVILEGAAHAQFLFQTDQRDRLLREIVRFLSAP
ncbi:MAG: alpha/beta fold hydrolase [Gemmatimonadaceae bacterium]